jgi:hypothetical protein
MVAWLDRGDTGAYLAHDTRALMAENRRKCTFRIIAGEGECVGVADTGSHYFHQYFTGLWTFQIYLGNFQGLASSKGYGGARLHITLLVMGSLQRANDNLSSGRLPFKNSALNSQ